MARLEVGIGATNKELKSVLADSQTLVRNFSNNLQKINLNIGVNDRISKRIGDTRQSLRSLASTAKEVRGIKIDLTLGNAINDLKSLNTQLTQTKKLYGDIRTVIQSINSTGRATVGGGGSKAALDAEKVAMAAAKREAQLYKNEIARVNAELAKLRLANAHARQSTTAASGSYREAQQRLTALGKTIRETAGGFNLNSKAVQAQIAQYRQLNAQLKAFDAAMGNHQRNVGNYPSVWGNVKNQLGAVAGSYMSLFAAIQGGRSVLRNNAEISDSIADIQRTAELSKTEARALFGELKQLETRTGLGELAEIAVIGGQLGIAKDQLAGFTEAVDMLSVVLKNEIPGGAEAVTEALGKINGVFRVAETEGLSAGQAMQKTGSAILALGQAGLATGEFMVDFTQRVGGAARTVGVALPTVLAYGAVLEEAGVSAEVAGTAVSKLIGQLAVRRNEFFAIARLADANLTLQQFTDLINTDADAALRKFFAGLQAGGGTTTQFYDILGKAKINTERYRNAVLLLSQDQEKLTELTALSTSEFEKGSKAAEQFADRNSTLGASIDKLSKSFVGLTTSGNMADFLQGFVDGITQATTSLDKLINSSSWKEFFIRLSGFGSTTGNLSTSLSLSSIQGDLYRGLSNISPAGMQSYVDTFSKQSLSEMKRLLKVQEDIVKLRSDTYQADKSRKNLDELNYQAEILAKIRREYELVNKEKNKPDPVSLDGTEELTKEQLRALEQQRKEQEKLWESIRKLREQNILNTLNGYEKELQAAKYRYAEELKAAKGNAKAIEAIILQRQVSIAQIIQASGTLTPSLQMSRAFGRTEYQRQQITAGQLNTGIGEVVAVDWSKRIAEQFKEVNGPNLDWSEFSNGLKRVTNQFTRNMMGAIEQIGGMTEKKGKDVIGLLGNTIIDSFSGITMNVVSNKLQKHLDESFDNLGKGLSENTGKWLQIGILGAGLVGQGVSGVSSRTNSGAQAVGGLLKGAAAGASFGSVVPVIGTAVGATVGAVIGGIAGWLGGESAKKQEKLTEQQLEEQRKQTALMERRNALAYTSQIIGQQTNQGIVTGVDRDEFGNIRFRIEGQDLVASLARTNDSIGRGV